MGKILIVDDEKDMCEVLAQYFMSDGYEVDIAYDAIDAIQKSRHKKYHFALVDLVMPGSMNGIDVIRHIKRDSPKTRIIAYSGFCDLDIADRVVNAGANYFLAKPFKQQQLAQVMFAAN
ncbi:MAG: response regulator [Calditrichaeota bacterium]|nr:response regulator [Calditrichota bacterium]